MGISDKAGERLAKVLQSKAAARRIAFDETVDPFFQRAKSVCEDALGFYAKVAAIARELRSEKFKDVGRLRKFVDEQRGALVELRQRMLAERIHLERTGNQVADISWLDDPEFKLAARRMTNAVLYVLREYDGSGSRPKTLLDGLDLLETGEGALLEHLGGLEPIIETCERSWGDACQIYEQIRVYACHGIFPAAWGARGEEGVPVVSPIHRLRARLFRLVRIVFWVIIILMAFASAITALGGKLENIYHDVQSRSGGQSKPN